MIQTVEKFFELFKLKVPKETVVYVEERKEYYKKNENGWEITDMFKTNANSNIHLTLYEMNQQLIAQLPTLEITDKEEKIVKDFVHETQNKYYMLYSKNIGYFTLFVKEENNSTRIESEIFECLRELGIIKSIENDKSALEIWVTTEANETHCLYFFPYDSAIITFGV